jgi:hypothetical protein
VFSNPKVLELAKDFVAYKADPQSATVDQDSFRHKSTQYVPEVVFLSPQGEVVRRLEDESVEGTVAAMKAVLATVRR